MYLKFRNSDCTIRREKNEEVTQIQCYAVRRNDGHDLYGAVYFAHEDWFKSYEAQHFHFSWVKGNNPQIVLTGAREIFSRETPNDQIVEFSLPMDEKAQCNTEGIFETNNTRWGEVKFPQLLRNYIR